MRAGPTSLRDVDRTPLPWKPASKGAHQVALFAKKFLTVPKGKGAGKPFNLLDWQLPMMAGPTDPECKIAMWCLPRGNGKSGLLAVAILHHLFYGGHEAPRVLVIAQDERGALRLLETLGKIVERSPELEQRVIVYKDRIEVPGVEGSAVFLPSEAHRVEGEDGSMLVVDEAGFLQHDTWEAALLSVAKRPNTKVLLAGTPSPAKWRSKSPWHDLVKRARTEPNDATVQLVEFSAPEGMDPGDPETWRTANPAMGPGGWLTEADMRLQFETVRPIDFARARLGRWPESSMESAIPPPSWHKCARPGVHIPRGSRVVVALDGSRNGDSTVLVVGSVSAKPHFQLGAPEADIDGIWNPRETGLDVPIVEVETAIRQLASYYRIVEVVADPYLWQRSLQILADDGIPVATFPQTPTRLTPATNDLRGAVVSGLLTHSDQEQFTKQVLAATLDQTSRGIKFAKASRGESIDAAAALVFCHSRCQWLGSKSLRRRKTRTYSTR